MIQFVRLKLVNYFPIWGSHKGDYSELYLVGQNAVQSEVQAASILRVEE
jgi:hypothetical protein